MRSFFGTVNTESFEVWTNCPRYREQRKCLGNVADLTLSHDLDAQGQRKVVRLHRLLT